MFLTCRSDAPVYGVYGVVSAPYTASSPYKSTGTGSVYGVYGVGTHIYIKDVKNDEFQKNTQALRARKRILPPYTPYTPYTAYLKALILLTSSGIRSENTTVYHRIPTHK